MKILKDNLSKIWLTVIIVLAFILRFYKLDSYPAINADEAAVGYNAYSLIQTGMDEHGNFWPIHFQSFNDYKPGLYFYLVLPFVKVLGLNGWAVRIPGAFLGAMTVLIVYFLVKELFSDENVRIKFYGLGFAEIAALMLAISPWHLHFSRGGWEVNAATFFITLGFWLFLKAGNNSKYYVLSISSFVISFYTYHAARVVVPLLGISLICFQWKRIRNNFKWFLVAGILSIILFLPLVRDLAKGSVFSRAAGVGLFTDPGPLNRINEQRGEHANYQGIIPKIIHNKAVNYGLAFLSNWSRHFYGEFLFLSGDEIQRDKVPETGEMYYLDFIWLIIGLCAIIKNAKNWAPILFWLIVAPIAAALTFQAPHAIRANNMVIPLVIISAYGLLNTLYWFKKQKMFISLITYSLLFIVIIWLFASYEHEYWIHMAKEYPYSSQYGMNELVNFIKENQSNYKKIIVTDSYDQPYILFLFYLKYPPKKFQEGHVLTEKDKFGFSTVKNFDKYYFEPIKFDEIRPGNPNSLIIGADKDIPKEANIVKKIHFPNGKIAFKIVAN